MYTHIKVNVSQIKYMCQVVVVHTFNPSMGWGQGQQRQGDLSQFQDSLTYRLSSGQSRLHKETLFQVEGT